MTSEKKEKEYNPYARSDKWWKATKLGLATTFVAVGIGYNAMEVPERYTPGAQTHNIVNQLEAKVLTTSAVFHENPHQRKQELEKKIDSLKLTEKYAKEESFLEQKKEEYKKTLIPYAVGGLAGASLILHLIGVGILIKESNSQLEVWENKLRALNPQY